MFKQLSRLQNHVVRVDLPSVTGCASLMTTSVNMETFHEMVQVFSDNAYEIVQKEILSQPYVRGKKKESADEIDKRVKGRFSFFSITVSSNSYPVPEFTGR